MCIFQCINIKTNILLAAFQKPNEEENVKFDIIDCSAKMHNSCI